MAPRLGKRVRDDASAIEYKVDIVPPPKVPYLSSADARPAHDPAIAEIGQKPAWGKDRMGKDVMFRCGDRLGLDAFRPMERIALNASGTFQRTVSSYYNAPVYVETDYNDCTRGGKCNRQVTMSVGGFEFAVCTSYCEVTRADLIDAVENKGIAIGQLFRHFEMMPVYALLAAGLDEAQPEHFIWRVYTLTVEGAVMCCIHEKIRRDVFDLQLDREAQPSSGGSGVDVVKPNVTYMELPDGFTKLERILLTANANVERIVGSYYNLPTIVHVMQNYRREPCVFERRTAMMLLGQEFMLATCTVFLADQKWEEYMQSNHKAGLGQVFTMMGVQPTFKLRDAGRTPHSFWRTYTLSCSAVTVQITECFNMNIFELDSSNANEYNFVYATETEMHRQQSATIEYAPPKLDAAPAAPAWRSNDLSNGRWRSASIKLHSAFALTGGLMSTDSSDLDFHL